MIHGQPAPVVGRVAMNMTMLDVTDIGADIDDEGARLLAAVLQQCGGDLRSVSLDGNRAHITADEYAPEPRRHHERRAAPAHQIGHHLPGQARRQRRWSC